MDISNIYALYGWSRGKVGKSKFLSYIAAGSATEALRQARRNPKAIKDKVIFEKAVPYRRLSKARKFQFDLHFPYTFP